MDAVRCKWYDDDGNPIRGGCNFSHKCRYIHPDNPAWPSARVTGRKGKKDDWRPPPSSDSGYRRTSFSGTERSTARHDQSTPSTWNDTGNSWGSSSNEPAMSTGGWGSTSQPERSTANTWNDTVNGWGSSSNEPATSPAGWGSTNSWGSGGAWGSGDGWGSSAAWGSSADGSRGWGESASATDAGWGSKLTATRNTDEPKAAVTLGNSTAEKPRSRRTSDLSDKSSQPASTNRLAKIDTRTPPTIAYKSPASAQQSYATISPRVSEDVEMKDATPTPSSSSGPTTAPRKIPLPSRIRPPLPTRLKQPPVSEHKHPLPSPKVHSASRVSQDDTASDISSPTSRSVKDTPKALHRKLIKAMMDAVIARYRLLKAEEKKNNWRAARASTCYLYSTPAAQKKLDSINQQYTEEIGKLTKKLHSSLRQIVRYSDALNAFRDLVRQGIDPQKIVSYTAELRDWIKDLDLPKRILMAQELAVQEEKEKKAFERRKQQEVDLLKASLTELEQRATDISDDFFYLQFIHDHEIEKVSKATEEAPDKHNPESFLDLEKLFGNLGIGKDAIRKIEDRAKVVDRDFEEQLTQVTELVGQVDVLEKQVEELRQKNREIQAFRAAAQAKLEQLAQWKTEDQAKLDDLSSRIENLHQLPRRQPRMASPPIRVEDLTPYTTTLAQEYVMQEIKPALDSIAESCQVNNKRVQADFDKLLGQILEKTYELCQAALKERGLDPQITLQQARSSTPT